jgi:hypothetical protein
MKALVCEMCNGTNLVKQEGVFTCQNCKTKYSVEEAKRMMVEGTVDVSGSTVKIDNSAKFENLYKVARRSREDGNTAQAFKNYEQLQLEDPDNWEPAFFVAYYSSLKALNNDKPGDSVRIVGDSVQLGGNYRSGLEPAIKSLGNCLDSVFDLIEVIEKYDEQKTAVEIVSDYVKSASENLKEIIHSEQSRMLREIGNFGRQIEGGMIKTTMMYNRNTKLGNSYRDDVSNILDLVEKRKTSPYSS